MLEIKSGFVSKNRRNHIWDKVLKSEPSKICGNQPFKNLKGYGQLNAVFHKFYLVHSWILCPICRLKYFIKARLKEKYRKAKKTHTLGKEFESESKKMMGGEEWSTNYAFNSIFSYISIFIIWTIINCFRVSF